MKNQRALFPAAILLAGLTIGTGFFGIPITAGPAGFYPTAVMLIIVWLYLLATGLLYLEATLASPDGANVLSICRPHIGWAGAILASVCFLIIYYIFLNDYYFLLSGFFSHLFLHLFDLTVNKLWFYCGITLVFGTIVFCGTSASCRLNLILFAGLIGAVVGTLVTGADSVVQANLIDKQWYLVAFAVPTVVTALYYQNLIPTLSTYLKRDAKRLVTMIVTGFSIPLAVYIAWCWLMIGTNPTGTLWEAFEQEEPILEGLKLLFGKNISFNLFHFTVFFALSTSLVSMPLAAVDFMCDVFKIPLERRRGGWRLFACLLVFAPSLIMSLALPLPALVSLNFLIGWAQVIFIGVIPIWLALQIRYIRKLPVKKILPGGKGMIGVLVLATFFLLYLEGVHILSKN